MNSTPLHPAARRLSIHAAQFRAFRLLARECPERRKGSRACGVDWICDNCQYAAEMMGATVCSIVREATSLKRFRGMS